MQKLEDGSFFDSSLIPTKERGEKLEAGFRVHEFVVNTVLENIIRYDDLVTKKLWIAFYRYAGCPMCASHFDEALSHARLMKEQNVAYMAVFDCPRTKVLPRFKERASREIMVIANDNLGLFENFGVEADPFKLLNMGTLKARFEAGKKGYSEESMSGNLARIPAHILVNAGGEVAHAHYGSHAGDHISWKTALDFIKSAPVSNTGLSLL
jgi:peroxiredoxin Q/BCP